MMTHEELWQNALSQIEFNISKPSFVTWFKGTRILDLSQGIITIAVPNAFAKEWLENKYHKFILKSLRDAIPELRSINYIILAEEHGKNNLFEYKNKFKKDAELPTEQLDFKEFHVDPITKLNPKYTFDNFIVGSFNDLAYAAALAVINNLGKAYNPLFIYGGVGLGKTHLIQAIGNSIKNSDKLKKVQYITSEKFANETIFSIQNNTMPSFKEKYRNFDLLIVDDVQFIAGKTKIQEEFFWMFNAIYDAGKQVVLSSDKPPQSITNLEERLRSRFEVGMVADISSPDYETRLAILKSKCEEKNIDIPIATLEIISSGIEKNIRELEGALNLIHMQSQHKNRILEENEVRFILNKNSKPKTLINPSQVIKIVSEFYDIPEKFMYEKTRKHEVVRPRQIAMYLIREDLGGSFPSIGQKFGGRDHTTAMHSYFKIKEYLKIEQKIIDEIKLIREKYQQK